MKRLPDIIAAIAIAVIILLGILEIPLRNKNSENTAADAVTNQYSETQPTPNNADVTKTVTVTAAGDCTLATDINASYEGSFKEKASDGDMSYFLKNFRETFSEDDITIVNFEGTLSLRGEREDKTYAFRGDPSYTAVLTSSSVEAANLANNHSLDYGAVSMSDTKGYLNKAGVINFENDDVAFKDVNGVKIGFVGINYLNDTSKTKLIPSIKKAKKSGAELIVLCIHWGIEKNTMPEEEQIAAAHSAIDNGADLVLGTHPHVLQGIEKYKGKYIAYSLGNFCFGGNNNPSDKDTALFRQTFTVKSGETADDDNFAVIPCRISSHDGYNDYQPKIAEGQQRQNIIDKLDSYSKKFGTVIKYR